MRGLHAWVVTAVLTAGPTTALAGAAEDVADALLPLLAQQGATIDRDTAVAALQRQMQAVAGDPALADTLPQGFAQAARLALGAENRATRGLMLDLTRESLATGAAMAGDAAADPIVAAWQKADPLLHETSGGAGLAQSDVVAIARLRELAGAPAGDPAAEVEAEWQRLSPKPVDLILPGRFNAWADGTAAAWDSLTPDERRIAAGVLTDREMPTPEVLQKVIGTEDMLGWLAAVTVPMTEAERAASPELLSLLDHMAFAGELQQPLTEMLAAGGDAAASSPMSAAAQLMRLNSGLAASGGLYSPGLGTYSVGGW